MTDRLSAIAQRMKTVRQLGVVVTAMRGIAASRQHEAEARLDAIRTYAASVGDAIGVALSLQPSDERQAVARRGGVLILLSAEQGFAGSFCDRALDAARPLLEGEASTSLMLVGSRGRMLAAARGLVVDWTAAMPLHIREVAAVANAIADALYERLERGAVSRVTLLHAAPGEGAAPPKFRMKLLLPFDYGRFDVKPSAIPPLITMPPTLLLPLLAQEYVFAELCEALVLAFAAENAARLTAMVAVTNNVREMEETLAQSYRQQRQSAITEEVVELATSGL